MADAPKQAAGLLFLHAQTGLHPGSGTALGAVDLPVQRERHTGWPTVPASALKGVLRDACREAAKGAYNGDRKRANDEDPALVAVFGPGKAGEASDHAGAFAVTDARLLAFPVRSLRGVFAWVTCPTALVRLARDLTLAGVAPAPFAVPNEVKDEQILCAANSPLLVGGTSAVLEEFEYARSGACDDLAAWLAARATDDLTRERLKGHLAVIGDNAFTHYAKHATEIVTRVGLDYDTKTVRDGALFYQEVLPAETLLYSVALANPSRSKDKKMTENEVLGYVADRLREQKVIQIGGDETVGKGLCFTRLVTGKELS